MPLVARDGSVSPRLGSRLLCFMVHGSGHGTYMHRSSLLPFVLVASDSLDTWRPRAMVIYVMATGTATSAVGFDQADQKTKNPIDLARSRL